MSGYNHQHLLQIIFYLVQMLPLTILHGSLIIVYQMLKSYDLSTNGTFLKSSFFQ